MKQKKENISRILVLLVLFALASAPQFTLLRRAAAQGPLNLRALNIDNEARQIVALVGTHVKFFKRSSELRTKGIVSPRDASDFKNEGDRRKDDLFSIKRELQSLINKLKQGNHWDATFDAQFLASLKKDSDRSLLTQNGGFRKLLEAAVGEISLLREEIDDEVRQVNNKQTGALRTRSDRVFAAHARPLFSKVGCNLLWTTWVIASVYGTDPNSPAACDIADRMNDKGCGGAPRRCP